MISPLSDEATKLLTVAMKSVRLALALPIFIVGFTALWLSGLIAGEDFMP